MYVYALLCMCLYFLKFVKYYRGRKNTLIFAKISLLLYHIFRIRIIGDEVFKDSMYITIVNLER